MKARLDLRLTQKLVMTPQLQQAIKLLQLSRLELNQVINQEMLENPLLEEGLSEAAETSEEEISVGEGIDKKDDREERGDSGGEEDPIDLERSDLDLKWEDYYFDDDREGNVGYASSSQEERPSYEQTLTRPISLVEHLLWQLGLSSVTEKEREIGTALIGNIDENGYVCSTVEEIAGALGSTPAQVEKVLNVIQGFDPSGVGARTLKECLLIQICQLCLGGSLVEGIISQHLEDLEKKRYAQISKTCNVSLDEVLHAARVIEHLEPKPGRPFASTDNLYIIPDVFVVKSEGKYIVLLNDDGLPKLRISPFYRSLLRSKDKVTDSTRTYIEDKFRSALWLVRSIEQRNRTISLVAQSIVKFQQEFMEKGISNLKPLILKQVADDISMHESTVSRVTTNKYMYTPQGIFELKFFFNSSLPRVGSDQESLSSIAVREMIRKLVLEEDPRHPLRDQEIVEKLKEQNIEIARRTVTKYRAWLKIAPASRRKRPF
jgi:RNA polymerase sigma-54 factor